MKTIFFEVPEAEQEALKQLMAGEDIIFSAEKISDENIHLAIDAEIVSVFINSVIDQTAIDKLPQLKLIATRSTGFDHIDVSYANSRGITVVNVPAYGSCTVAEFAFALLLNLSRKVYVANQAMRQHADFSIYSYRGFDLKNKTIGVIGTGRIGKNVINMALGFGMKVLAYDLHPDMKLSEEKGFVYKDLDEILKNSDVLTLHTPYSKDSFHLLSKEKFSIMKKGMFLINTARGELIDTDALIWAINEGIVAGAGLDVLEGERELKEEIEILSDQARSEHVKSYKTLFEDRILMDLPNVVVTPHIAFYSKEAEEEIIKTTVENIKGFKNNQSVNVVSGK